MEDKLAFTRPVSFAAGSDLRVTFVNVIFRFTVTAMDPTMKSELQNRGFIAFPLQIASCEYGQS